jgi:hypothetical protein
MTTKSCRVTQAKRGKAAAAPSENNHPAARRVASSRLSARRCISPVDIFLVSETPPYFGGYCRSMSDVSADKRKTFRAFPPARWTSGAADHGGCQLGSAKECATFLRVWSLAHTRLSSKQRAQKTARLAILLGGRLRGSAGYDFSIASASTRSWRMADTFRARNS